MTDFVASPGWVPAAERHTTRWAEPAVRFTLVVIFAWFGALKFTAFEAKGIAPLIMHSPFLSWLLPTLGMQGASNLIGTWELATAILLVIGYFQPRIGVIGAIGAVVTFAVTISFFFTTPMMWEPKGGGFPAISMMGSFLLKDWPLFGASLYLLGRGLNNAKLAHVAGVIMQATLALFFLVLGVAKFYGYEAMAIAPLIEHSPLLAWLTPMAGVTGQSQLIGLIEILAAGLLAARLLTSSLSAVGAAIAAVTLLITLSFMLTTPGVCEPTVGCPALSVKLGQFLIKDLGLLGVAIWALAASLRDHQSRRIKTA